MASKRRTRFDAMSEAQRQRDAKRFVADVREELDAREWDGRYLTHKYWKEVTAFFIAGSTSADAVSSIISDEKIAERQRRNRYFMQDLVTLPHPDHLIWDSPGHARKNRRVAVNSIRRAQKATITRGVGGQWGRYPQALYNILHLDNIDTPLGGAVIVAHVVSHNPEAALHEFLSPHYVNIHGPHPKTGRFLAVSGARIPLGTHLDREQIRSIRDPQRSRRRLRARKRRVR